MGCGHALRTALTVGEATRIEPHRRTRSDRARQLIFLCSALAAHVPRLSPRRFSQFSKPTFFCRSFFSGHCFRLIPASCSFAASAFTAPHHTQHGSPPTKQPLALEAEALALGAQKNGAEKGDIFMSYLYVKWNSFVCGSLANG